MASSVPLCGLQLPVFAFPRHEFIVSAPQRIFSGRRMNYSTYKSKSTSLVYVIAESQSEWWKREEERWLREEQRWLREEQRWLREEARWLAELRTLQAQISSLTRQLQRNSPAPAPAPAPAPQLTLSGVDSEDQISTIRDQISTVNKSPQLTVSGVDLKDRNSTTNNKNENRKRDQISTVNNSPQLIVSGVDLKDRNSTNNKMKKKNKERTTLKRGSRGDDVKEMQEALQRLGFYSGEEDMEYSSFGGGTQRAVKSWQAMLGIVEDGTMSVELLAKLLGEEMLNTEFEEELINGASVPLSEKEGINGSVPIAAVTETAHIQQAIRIEPEGVEISENRVYLLGENRWEEPQRLINNKNSGTKLGTTARCISCRGEGKILCTECEGTGDLNVEEQFLEWAEGAKCPYCEGLGYSVCDMCEGKTERF